MREYSLSIFQMHRFGLAAFVVLGTLVQSIASATIPESPATSSATPSSSNITPVVPMQPIATYIPPATSTEASVTRIFSYNGGGFENLALRSNGQILTTIAFPAPLLFYIDPSRSGQASSSTISRRSRTRSASRSSRRICSMFTARALTACLPSTWSTCGTSTSCLMALSAHHPRSRE